MALRIPRPHFKANKHFWLGIVGAAVIVALLVGSSFFKTAGVGDKTIHADFVQAAGIRVGDKVKVSGVDVGQVKSAELDGDHVSVGLQVEKDLGLGPDAHATIKMSTLLGARYVDLETGDGNGLPDNHIPVTNTSVPYDLAEVVEVGTPKFEAIDEDMIAQSLNLLDAQLGDSPHLAAHALDSVGALAEVINDRRQEVDRLLKNLDAVTDVMADNRNNILIILGQGEAIFDRIMERQRLVQQLLDDVGTLSRQLQEIGVQNDGQLGPMIRTLDTMSQGLQKNRENLDHLLQIMPVTVRQFNNTFGSGNYGDVAAPWLFPDNWLCMARVAEGCR